MKTVRCRIGLHPRRWNQIPLNGGCQSVGGGPTWWPSTKDAPAASGIFDRPPRRVANHGFKVSEWDIVESCIDDTVILNPLVMPA